MIEHVWLEHGIVRWHIGAVSAQQYQFSNAELREDSRFGAVHYLIDDFLDCTALPEIELVASVPVRCADWMLPHAEFRQAIVSSSAALRERAYRLALFSMSSPATMKFSDMAKAREWVKGDVSDRASATTLQWAGAGIAAAPAAYARAR